MSSTLRESDLAFALLKAAQAISLVLREGRSLDQAVGHVQQDVLTAQARGAIQDLSYYGLRNAGRGFVLMQLLTKKNELNPLELTDLMILGLGLLWPSETPKYPAHTVVNQMVNACEAHSPFQRAKGLVNACLRTFLRETEALCQQALKDPLAQFNLPDWWLERVQRQHPQHWRDLVQQAQTQAPLVLRVNTRWGTPQQYVARLVEAGMPAQVIGPQAVWVHKGVPVENLPGFALGHVSVQDHAAQWAAPLLDVQDGQRVLDACAAPGGKTGHLLECANIHVLALDISASRLKRVESTVERLLPTLPASGWSFECQVAQAQNLDAWWDGEPFDAVLADVPCTGSGVVRRHPDIPWLRREQDVANLSHKQHEILDALWSTLRPGGKLLLVTCSIFLEEGPELSKAFTANHPDALPLPAPGLVLPDKGTEAEGGSSVSPDGFFYALFQKQATH
jgi:16S rRNA (cytosine967-C5)-methyltransferase